MPSPHTKTATPRLHRVLFAIGAVGLSVTALRLGGVTDALEGYLVRKPLPTYEWKVIDQKEVMSGAIIPADTHVVFHLPPVFTRINRETLLGQKGEKTRYWGYCFPENAPSTLVNTRTGFPGLIFFSEKERAVRALADARKVSNFTPGSRLPTKEEAAQLNNPVKPALRHQLEVFKPNTMCYIMSDESLSIGLDADNDRLNDELEREVGTNKAIPDSDGDGISDGTEYIHALKPLIRDSDNDGIIDGIEDANWNGRTEIGETDPRTRDTDRDGLCDGMCRVRLQRQDLYIGEDKNLNGVVDSGETDPRKYSTQSNGISDETIYLKCIAAGKEVCP
jgi:hypothetical protein